MMLCKHVGISAQALRGLCSDVRSKMCCEMARKCAKNVRVLQSPASMCYFVCRRSTSLPPSTLRMDSAVAGHLDNAPVSHSDCSSSAGAEGSSQDSGKSGYRHMSRLLTETPGIGPAFAISPCRGICPSCARPPSRCGFSLRFGI
jgi:hypothetical protein